MNKRCLICLNPTDETTEYHSKCSKSFFGVSKAPTLDLTRDTVQQYAAQSILARSTITGVQKKLSLGLEGNNSKDTRLTVVGLWGNFILKPPSDDYPFLPENEDTVMRVASLLKIPVVPHAMIRLATGELSYITRRIDRDKLNGKIPMEDFCQISERLTEDKYKGSVERIGKLLREHSIFPGLDISDLFERVLFNFIIGNSDMHLKSYSLIETPQGMRLSPAYDLLSTVLAIPEDPEESALTINGKKSKLALVDFDSLAQYFSIPNTVVVNLYKKFTKAKNDIFEIIENGYLPADLKSRLKEIVKERVEMFIHSTRINF
jgi:serine/threonine-protein kinase HipA